MHRRALLPSLSLALAACSGTTQAIRSRDIGVQPRQSPAVPHALGEVTVTSRVAIFDTDSERANSARSRRQLLLRQAHARSQSEHPYAGLPGPHGGQAGTHGAHSCGKEGHSVFAAALYKAPAANEAVIDMSQMFSFIRREVALHAEQFPEYGDIRQAGHDGGDFLFVRAPRK